MVKHSAPWDKEQRIFLDATYKFTHSLSHVHALYHEKFRAILANERTKAALSAQYCERFRDSSWFGICQTKEFYLTQRPDLVLEIESLAQRLGMRLPQAGDSTFKVTPLDTPALQRGSIPGTQPYLKPTPANSNLKANHTAQEWFRLVRDGETWPFEAVPRELAHPPVAEIFFRFYDAKSAGINEPFGRGFISGKHRWSRCGIHEIPLTENLKNFEDFEIHIGQVCVDGDPLKPIPSPFISVSSSLAWTIRQAMKLKLRDGRDFRIAFIDGATAAGKEGRAAFHCPPYYRQLREHCVFDGGKHRYGGKAEFLIWGKIPPEAIICDFALEDLENLCASEPDVGSLFRLNRLCPPGPTDAILDSFKKDGIELDSVSLSAIATFLHWTLNSRWSSAHSLNKDHVAKLISDITGGWSIRIQRSLSISEWADAAEYFAEVIGSKCRTTFGGQQRHDIKYAFLSGLRSSYGDLNWIHTEGGIRRMGRRAQEVGLVSPELILPSRALSIMNLTTQVPEEPEATAVSRSTARRRRISVARQPVGVGMPKPSTPELDTASQLVTPPQTTKQLRQITQQLLHKSFSSPPTTPTPIPALVRRRTARVVIPRTSRHRQDDDWDYMD